MLDVTIGNDNKSVVEFLRLKPTVHGPIWIYQIKPLNNTISESRKELLVNSLKSQGTNLIPLNIRRLAEEEGEYEYQIITGNDWLLAANSINIEKLVANIIDIEEDQIKEFQSNYNQLLGIDKEEPKETNELDEILGEDQIDSQLFNQVELEEVEVEVEVGEVTKIEEVEEVKVSNRVNCIKWEFNTTYKNGVHSPSVSTFYESYSDRDVTITRESGKYRIHISDHIIDYSEYLNRYPLKKDSKGYYLTKFADAELLAISILNQIIREIDDNSKDINF